MDMEVALVLNILKNIYMNNFLLLIGEEIFQMLLDKHSLMLKLVGEKKEIIVEVVL